MAVMGAVQAGCCLNSLSQGGARDDAIPLVEMAVFRHSARDHLSDLLLAIMQLIFFPLKITGCIIVKCSGPLYQWAYRI